MVELSSLDSEFAIRCRYKDAVYSCVFPGHPLGFVVARGMSNPVRRQCEGWAYDLRVFLEHEFGEDFQLNSSPSERWFIVTRAWYQSKVHCDPENTHKLVKDVLFRAPLNGSGRNNSDKYTAGFYSAPCIDPANPRLELFVWRLPSHE